MSSPNIERKLAAIMFTDIAGYTEQMSEDQDVAFILLEDKSYLESAFNQVQEKASAMEDGEKFLSYPIPKAIVEEWHKINN